MLEKNLSLEETFNLAIEKHKLKHFKIAEELYNKILIKKPNHIQTIFSLGTLFVETNNLESAIKLFQKVIRLQPKHALAHSNLGMIYIELKNFANAIVCLKTAIIINPDLTNTRNTLCRLLRYLRPTKLSEKEQQDLKDLFLILYKRNDVDHNDIFKNAKNVLFSEKNYKEILKEEPKPPLLKNINIKNLIKEDLFLLMMQKSLISDPFIEKILIQIRKEILIGNNNRKKDINDNFDFIVSFAEQCSLNEHVYIRTKNETEQIKNLQANLEKNKKINELDVAILGCYVPLNTSEKLKEKLINYKSKNILFNDLIVLQIKEIDKEEQLKTTIKSNDNITDKVSKKVRNQYEENPYPRWRHLYTNDRKNFLIGLQNQIKPNKIDVEPNNKFRKPNVLIAGCGTGRHLLIADNYLDANILGVDLSLSSLAYAKRKIEEKGLKNIEFLQSDILNLKNLKRKFDIIESIGVLHHMKDPLKGLKVLLDLLKPYGLMKLGLYSKIARQHITYARKFASGKNFKGNIEDIRKCRCEIFNAKNDNLLKKVSLGKDFYTVSSVRDLIFNEQEHCFSIPEISKILYKFKLEFLGFSNSFIKNQYSKTYREDKKNIFLDNWNNYEKINPDTFNSMYSFWVRKII